MTDVDTTARVLVLSGGGRNGAFQLGVLQRLQEENKDLRYDAIFGVSTGALTGAVLAQGNTAQSQRHYANAALDTEEATDER